MRELLHTLTSLFHAAYTRYEEEPSDDVWKNVSTTLDKKKLASFKRRVTAWKRVALFSLLLLLCFTLYEFMADRRDGERVYGDPVTTKQVSQPLISESSQTNKVPVASATANRPANKNEEVSAARSNADRRYLSKYTDARRTHTPLNRDDGWDLATRAASPTKKNQFFLINTGLEKLENPRTLLFSPHYVSTDIHQTIRTIQEKKMAIAGSASLSFSLAKALPSRHGPFQPFWTITGYLSMDFANYRLDNDMPTIQKIEQREQPEPSFSGAVLITRQFTPRWALQTGIGYAYTGIAIQPQKIYAAQDQNGNITYKYVTSSGYAYIKPGFGGAPTPGDSLLAASAKHSLQHVMVPVLLDYTFLQGDRFSITAGAGVAANFLLSARIETEIENAFNHENVLINQLNGERHIYWSLLLNASVNYRLNKQFCFTVRPLFRYAVSSSTKDNDVQTFPYSAGLGAGITYKF